MCLSFFIGYHIWRKRQKPLCDKAMSFPLLIFVVVFHFQFLKILPET